MPDSRITIREFTGSDREAVRRISLETAFLGEPREHLFSDDEILADALTLYYTEYEPGSCFVAAGEKGVAGYIIGTTNVQAMKRIFIRRIIPRLIKKAFKKRVFFNKNTRRLMTDVALSFLKGEFSTPDFSKKYPAALHVNIGQAFRGQDVGRRLVEHYLGYLKGKNIAGVHFGTVSEGAKAFFLKAGFTLLYSGRRSFLRYHFGKDIPYYIFGKLLNTNPQP